MFELLINEILRRDQSNTIHLQRLHGKNIAIYCHDFVSLNKYISFEEKQINCSSSAPNKLDVTISGRLKDYVQYAIFRKSDDLEIRGDAQVAALIEKLYRDLDIDWEEELSKITGDALAHQILHCFARVRSYAQLSANSLGEMITEYLQEETYTLPTHCEVDDFMQEVDELRLRVDRLEARMKTYESN